MKKSKSIIIKIFVAVTYVAMIVVNFLANALPINGVTPGEVSDSYPNLFAPAGLTFSIWGVIYLLLGLYVLYQFGLWQKKASKDKAKLLDKIGLFFIITSLANLGWIFAWHYGIIWLSALLIITILIFLIKIADTLRVKKLLSSENFFLKIPFSIYFGWITVATIANITVLLVSLNWNGFGWSDQLWTILVLAVGVIIGTIRIIRDKNFFYGLVLAWAYFGIWFKHFSFSGFYRQYTGIIIIAIIGIFIFLIVSSLIACRSICRRK